MVFGFIFTFLLGRRPGFFALGSCGKPQRGRKATAPLHTPRAFFKEFLVVDEGRVLTCVCMLGYWMWDAVPIWFLYASVLDAGCCADLFFGGYGRLLYWLWIVLRPFSVCFGVGCGTLCRSGSCILRCWTWNAVPIYFYILYFFCTGQDVHLLLFSALCG